MTNTTTTKKATTKPKVTDGLPKSVTTSPQREVQDTPKDETVKTFTETNLGDGMSIRTIR